MTIEEQVQAEAKGMVEDYYNLNCDEDYGWSTDIPIQVAQKAALLSINKIISLRVPPMEHYEQIKEAIINYK